MMELIAHPTRLRIVRRLADRGRGSLTELADAAGVHPNTARAHVAALAEAGVLEGTSGPARGRGRPGVDYRLAEGWTIPTTDFLPLAELLAAALVRSGQTAADLRSLGREWGRYLAGRPGAGEPAADVPRALERLGFDARLEDRALRLTGCPCPLVSPDRPELVCALATGVAEGILAGSDPRLRVGAGRHDPARRSCRLTLRASRRQARAGG